MRDMDQQKRRVLITGASVAGTTLAWWLNHWGFDVTVVERHPQFLDGGQNIDVRGAGRDVLHKMRLEDVVARNGTGEEGIRFVNENNETIAEFDVDEIGPDGPTAELEILRGDLAESSSRLAGTIPGFASAIVSRISMTRKMVLS